jgi:hypothetical protein
MFGKEIPIDSRRFLYMGAHKTPRGPEGELNEKTCDFCGNSSGALARLGVLTIMDNEYNSAANYWCKGCLLKAIELVDEAILREE